MSYFTFQPVLHDWYDNSHGMCYPVCKIVHIKKSFLLIGKSRSLSGGSRFPLLLNKIFPFFLHEADTNLNKFAQLCNNIHNTFILQHIQLDVSALKTLFKTNPSSSMTGVELRLTT